MAAATDLGGRHVCVSCGTSFFDFGKFPLVCPSCHIEQPMLAPKVDEATIDCDITRIIERLDVEMPEARKVMDALLSRLRTIPIAA